MDIYQDSVDLIYILAIAREILPMFKEGTVLCNFYCAYLKERIEFCFKQNRDYFKQKEPTEGFGKVP